MKIPEELEKLKEICFVCKERMFTVCGEPRVVIGGCCVGAEWKGTRWIICRYAHYSCYRNMKKQPKLMLTEDEVKKLIKKY